MAAAAGPVVVSIDESPSADAAAAGDEVPPPQEEGEGEGERGGDAAAADCPEKQLARFVHFIVFLEWVGNASGTLALAWATTVLLGGFSSALNRQDFWFATFMIFVESVRVFSHHHKLDSHYLFGTTGALRWINSSFSSMLGRPQEGSQLVLIMGLCFSLIEETIDYYYSKLLGFVLKMALVILWIRRPQRPGNWQMRAVAIAYLLFAAFAFIRPVLPIAPPNEHYYYHSKEIPSFLLFQMLPVMIKSGAVLLLNLRPQGLVSQTSTPFGRRLISMAKLTSALWLAAEALILFLPLGHSISTILGYCLYLNTSITMLVLSLGSLQNRQVADTDSLFGGRTNATLLILLLFHFVGPFPFLIVDLFMPGTSDLAIRVFSLVVLLVLLLLGNLQLPTAIAQILLSLMRLRKLLGHEHIDYSYSPQQTDRHPNHNMVRGLQVFYVLALCQGALYIMAIFLGLFFWLPQRWLIRRSKFSGKLGEKAIGLYYKHAYKSRIEDGVFGPRSMIKSFANFATDSLSSSTSSRDQRVAGLYVLHNILLKRKTDRSTQDLIHRVTSGSGIAVSFTLIDMLAGAAEVEKYGCDIRLLAARVLAKLASNLRISSIPGMLKPVSLLLKLNAENSNSVVRVPNEQGEGHQQTPLAIANGGWSWVLCRFWQWMKKKYWSIPEEPTLSHQDSLLVQGMAILEKLACDHENRVEIFKDDTANLISKTIRIIGLATSDNEQNDELVRSSLEFLRWLATTGERIGKSLRHELWKHPFLLTCLARVLVDDRSSSSSSSPHQIWEQAMDIVAKLALDSAAGPEIGRNQAITARLLHVFLGRHGPANDTNYDRSLRKVSGEALANLALWGAGTAKCILEEPRNDEVINDLKNMLSDDDHDEHRYVAASLLLNLCAHCHSANVNLVLSHPRASEHLSSGLTIVMGHIIAAEGKQLECLINLASEIGNITPQAFARELESQTNYSGVELVQKLVGTLNSKKIPNPEYPRMRMVIIKILITILRSGHHDTVEKLIEEGMMEQLKESLTKIEKTPSRVEDYKVFYGNIGVVREDAEAEPMSVLVATAKTLLAQRITQAGEAQRR